MMAAMFSMVLLQAPIFSEPPPQAPDMAQWGDDILFHQNSDGGEQVLFRVETGNDVRTFLDDQGVCRHDTELCILVFQYRLTLNAREQSDATVAVLQFAFLGPFGKTQGIGWVTMGVADHRCFLYTDEQWHEVGRGHPHRSAVVRTVDGFIRQGRRRLSERKEESQ